MILFKLVLGAGMIAATVAVHALFMEAALRFMRLPARRAWLRRRPTLAVIGMVLWLFLAICLECWLWAALFLRLEAVPDLETALYFATVTYSTLGYGDVVLGEDWRLLSAFAAANGAIVFGWTTALVFLAAQRLHALGD